MERGHDEQLPELREGFEILRLAVEVLRRDYYADPLEYLAMVERGANRALKALDRLLGIGDADRQQRLDQLRENAKKMTPTELAAAVALLRQRNDDLTEELKVLAEQLAMNAAEHSKRRHPR